MCYNSLKKKKEVCEMKNLKKVISIILCVLMIFGTFGFAMASAAYEGEHLPQIYVCGIGSRAVYYADDPEKKSLFLSY